MKCAHEKKALAAFSSALKRIKPVASEARRDFEAAGRLIRKLESVVPPSVEVRLAGSLAKGTNLAGKNEFDIFLLFPKHYPHHEMALLGLSYARRAFSGMRVESRYAEHPYLQVFSGDYHADIVPAYKIGDISERGSAVDRSVLHTQYVNAKLGAKGKDEVRLLKRFMKNFGIYGAELRVEGFSGYLCELLVIKYGSLLSLFEHAAGWAEPAFDMEGKLKGEDLRKRFSSPLVVIDPVDPNRNVAAVVAHTSLSRFVFECRCFLQSPSAEFFHAGKKPRSMAEIRKMVKSRGTQCLAVRFIAHETVPDVLWPQLKKAAQALCRHLQLLDFSVFGCYHWSDGKECVILFELDRWQLPPIRKAVGPAVKYAKDVSAFVRRHSGCINLHIEHDRVVATERRKATQAAASLADACRSPKGLGIPQGMERQLAKCSIAEGAAIVKGKYSEFLADYFFAKIA